MVACFLAGARSVHIVLGVVDVEMPGWRDQARILDDGLQPERHFGRFRRRVLDHLGLVETDAPPVE